MLEQKFINIKNPNIKRYAIHYSIYNDNFDYLKDIMEGLRKFYKFIKMYIIPNLYDGYINVHIEFDFYTEYKVNLIRKKIKNLQFVYLDRHKFAKL